MGPDSPPDPSNLVFELLASISVGFRPFGVTSLVGTALLPGSPPIGGISFRAREHRWWAVPYICTQHDNSTPTSLTAMNKATVVQRNLRWGFSCKFPNIINFKRVFKVPDSSLNSHCIQNSENLELRGRGRRGQLQTHLSQLWETNRRAVTSFFP